MNKKMGSSGKSGGGILGKSTTGKSSFGSAGGKSGKSMVSSSGKSGSLLSGGGKSTSLPGVGKSSSLLPGGGKSSSLLPGGGKSSSLLGGGGKNNSAADSNKSFLTPSALNPKSGKSSTSFGIIWLPTRRSKHKNYVYNPHKDDRSRSRERSPAMYNLMPDSPDNQLKKKTEPTESSPADRLRDPAVPVAGIGLVATAEELAATQEKQELLHHDTKEAAGDTNEHLNDDEDDYLENDSSSDEKTPEADEKRVLGDKVDSVYLRAPPPHKTRSSAGSPPEDESCGLKCLYYTLQCCDCVLM